MRRGERGRAIFEASRDRCGTSYAMDQCCDYFEINEDDPRESRLKFPRAAS